MAIAVVRKHQPLDGTNRPYVDQASSAGMPLMAAICHDMRQPLHALTCFATALESRLAAVDVENVAKKIRSCTATLQEMVSSLEELATLQPTAGEPSWADVSVGELFRRLEHEFADTAAAKKLDLVVRPTPLIVRGDVRMLYRILQNLLANAVRYTVAGRIVVDARRHADGVVISVADTGPGVGADDVDFIFQPFYRGRNSRSEPAGLGLGLATVKSLCDAMRYQLDVFSMSAAGSTFRITAPAV